MTAGNGGLGRRNALRTGLAATAAVALGAAGAPRAQAGPGISPAGREGGFPPVPGMLGDRHANEFWYQYEVRFSFEAPAEIADAYTAIEAAAGGGGMFTILDEYERVRREGEFPGDYLPLITPAREAYGVLSRHQLDVIDRHYGGRHRAALPWAFVHMGEGSLWDPRMPGPHKLHVMPYGANGVMTRSWHFWHAVTRAATLLGFSRDRWREIDPLVGLGWAVQSIAYPDQNQVNPEMDRRTAERLIRRWRHRSPRAMDTA